MSARVANVLTVMSVVICVASLALVARSFFREDRARFLVGGRTCGIVSIDATLTLWHERYRSKPYFTSGSAEEARLTHDLWWKTLRGFPSVGIAWREGSPYDPAQYIILPLWLVPILTVILPLRWWRRRRLHTRGFAVVEAPAAQT